MKALFPASLMAITLLAAGCGGPTGPETRNIQGADMGNSAPISNDAVAPPPTDAWIGRWNGPEGLFLDIQPAKTGGRGHYAIRNQDTLDRTADYAGVAEGTTIRFVRDGQDLAIRPGSGADTGFKYLADRKICLIVQPGREGYCR